MRRLLQRLALYTFQIFIARPVLKWLVGVRYRRLNLVPDGPCLVVSNHNSHLDAAVLMSMLCKESAVDLILGLGVFLLWGRRDRSLAVFCFVLGALLLQPLRAQSRDFGRMRADPGAPWILRCGSLRRLLRET